MSKGYKSVKRKSTYADAIADGYSAIEELASEMRDAYDNCTGSGMSDSHPKVEAFSTAADELENANQPPDVPDELTELMSKECELTTTTPRDRRRGPARWARLSDACNAIQVAKDYLEDLAAQDGLPEEIKEAAGQLASELDDAASLDGSVDFPGMYG